MIDSLNYRYQTIQIGAWEIHIRSLRDIQEFSDDNNIALDLNINSTQWSLFGVIWPSSLILAEVMSTKEIEGKSILEVGCGLAISSILLSLRGANIKASDYHPSAESFLKENIRINKCDPIPFIRTDWQDEPSSKNDEKFDLIIGSDILYERNHPHNLSHYISFRAKKKCEVIIVDPNRGNQNNFKREMGKLGFTHSQDDRLFLDQIKKKFKGHVHYFNRD